MVAAGSPTTIAVKKNLVCVPPPLPYLAGSLVGTFGDSGRGGAVTVNSFCA